MSDIPFRQLHVRTNIGLQIKYFKQGDPPESYAGTLRSPHRDDYYVFFMLERGYASMMVDFHKVEMFSPALFFVLPTQVHQRIANESADYWFIAIDTALISRECRDVFERHLLLQSPFSCSEEQLTEFQELLHLLYKKYMEENKNPLHIPAVQGLIQSFLYSTAACYNDFLNYDVKRSRLSELTSDFKKILSVNFLVIKSPSAYAAKLSVSETYLNEALKKTTGFPVSYWIQQEIMMEAKRLLYHSELNIKEIAHRLGYENHSYFSRFFRKIVGMSAQAFREQYRK